jgi:hypothetical protein
VKTVAGNSVFEMGGGGFRPPPPNVLADVAIYLKVGVIVCEHGAEETIFYIIERK